MNQSSSTSSQDVIKSPTTLDKIPEDVQLAIIRCIQSWRKSEGTEQEREKGKRARDSALRAVALSCRKLLDIYRPEMLSSVTVNNKSIMRFYLSLARTPESGKWVRSITFARRDVDQLTQQEEDQVHEDVPAMLEAFRDQWESFEEQVSMTSVMERVYQFLPNIQTLIIHQSDYNVAFQSKHRLAPLPFLTHSLRKLFIPMWKDSKCNLKARNVVWILVFCTGLRSAALGCVFDLNDFKYLAEFSKPFSGLSQVQRLSLGVNFTFDESIRRFWDAGVGKQWIGGNQKTQAMFNLLKVTKNLQCLEINYISLLVVRNVPLNSSCLSALGGSYGSLEFIRLFRVGVKQDDLEECKARINLSLFQELKVISFDTTMVPLLSTTPCTRLPSSLRIICISFYNLNFVGQQDLDLVHALKVGSFPSLESVVVPSRPISMRGLVTSSEDVKRRWLQGRRELEKAEIFQGGKVKLRIVEPGESIGESSETDFMSTLSWISPP